jgi:hypothetical protein
MLNPTALTLKRSITSYQNTSGTVDGPGAFAANYLAIDDHAVNAPGDGITAAFHNGLNMSIAFGGPNTIGGLNAIEVDGQLTAPTSASNTNRNYVASFGQMTALTGDGGTNSMGGAQGAVFGSNFYGHLAAGAINLLNVSASEFDVQADAGSSVAAKTGIQISLNAADAVQGSLQDSAITLGNQNPSGPGFKNFLEVGNHYSAGKPISAGGTILKLFPGEYPSAGLLNGIDFSDWTFTGKYFNSINFQVDESGAVMGRGNSTVLPPSLSTGWAIQDNFSNGKAEVNLINTHEGGGGFDWRQKTGASAATKLAALDGGGNLTAAGYVKSTMSVAAVYDYFTPLTGATITVGSGSTGASINPAGTLTSLTVKLPVNPINGQIAHLGFTQVVTTLTVQDSAGVTANVLGAPASAAIGTSISLIYNNSLSKWVIF